MTVLSDESASSRCDGRARDVGPAVRPGRGVASRRRYRITFLTVIPSPYQVELFDGVARHPDLDPTVYYYAENSPNCRWTPPLLPAYSTILPGVAIHALTRCCCLNPSAIHRLRQDSPDLVVVGDYFTLTAQLVMRDLTRRGVPWVFWGELPGLNRRSCVGDRLRRFAQQPILRGAHGVVAIGSRAQTAYRTLLGDDRPVFNVPYHCDLSAYLAIERPPRTPEQPVRFLCSAQMIHRKGIDVLVRAFVALARRMPASRPVPMLTLLGEGEERQRYEALVPADLRDRVVFRGFCQPQALPRAFAEADVFVLPSRHDGWGVVVNEAIASGMPVIATEKVGAAHDLIRPGRNGFVIAADDVAALEQSMRHCVEHPDELASSGQCSRVIAQDYTVERGAQRWHTVCQQILAGRVVSMSPEVEVAAV